jgi:hypothetical protein
MTRAPEKCTSCALTFPTHCNASNLTDPYRGEWEPGLLCPFVRLDAIKAKAREIADDYVPFDDRQTQLAIDQMREAIQALGGDHE